MAWAPGITDTQPQLSSFRAALASLLLKIKVYGNVGTLHLHGVHGCLPASEAELSRCHRDLVTHNAKDTHYLVFYRKRLPNLLWKETSGEYSESCEKIILEEFLFKIVSNCDMDKIFGVPKYHSAMKEKRAFVAGPVSPPEAARQNSEEGKVELLCVGESKEILPEEAILKGKGRRARGLQVRLKGVWGEREESWSTVILRQATL